MTPHTGKLILCSSIASIHLERGSSPLRVSNAAIIAGFKEIDTTSRRLFFGNGFRPMIFPSIYLLIKLIFTSNPKGDHLPPALSKLHLVLFCYLQV
jgi:hypothetical protein